MDEKLIRELCYEWIHGDNSQYKRLEWLSKNSKKGRVRSKNLNRLEKMHPKYKIFRMIEEEIGSELMWYQKELLYGVIK